MNAHIERACDADGPSILQLLRDAGLPIDGLVEHLNTAYHERAGADERPAVDRIPFCVSRQCRRDAENADGHRSAEAGEGQAGEGQLTERRSRRIVPSTIDGTNQCFFRSPAGHGEFDGMISAIQQVLGTT